MMFDGLMDLFGSKKKRKTGRGYGSARNLATLLGGSQRQYRKRIRQMSPKARKKALKERRNRRGGSR